MFPSTSELRTAVTAFASRFDADAVDPAEAARLVADWAAIEHAAATVKGLAAARVASTSAWRGSGAPSAAGWLARTTGSTAARAREQLATAEQLRALDAIGAAARRGEVSPTQVAAIAGAAAADPTAERRLLEAAPRQSVAELRLACARTKAAADPDPDATAARIHAARCLRRWSSADGVHHLHASGPAELLARIDSALAPRVEARFAAARAEGGYESHDAYAFDALVDLVDEKGAPAPARARTRFRAVLRVDWTALLRGRVDEGETCEIAGLGPVSVARARELLGDAVLHLVITRGVGVANVTYLGRGPSAAQRIALLWQMPTCSRLGCNRTARIEVDHRRPYAADRVTELANLDPLCGHDHRLKTNEGWALVEGTGKRLFVPPDHPDHPRHAQRHRRSAIASHPP